MAGVSGTDTLWWADGDFAFRVRGGFLEKVTLGFRRGGRVSSTKMALLKAGRVVRAEGQVGRGGVWRAASRLLDAAQNM